MRKFIYLLIAILIGATVLTAQTNQKASITVTFPNGGEHWIKDTYTPHNITWESVDVTNFKIEFSSDNGANWTIIEENYSGGDFYSWQSADVISAECLIKVSEAEGDTEDVSNEVFTISDQEVYIAEWNTSMGIIRTELRGDLAPLTVQNFINLADREFYYNLIFHRVVQGFVIQDGCPDGTGSGGPDWSIDLEIHQDLRHNDAGIIAMARASNPNSAGSQYYFTLDPEPGLDDNYAVFGRTIDGINTILEIGDVEVDGNDRPIEDVNIYSVDIVESNPELNLINPNNEYGVFVGTIFNIEWESDFVADVKIELSSDNGNNWTTLIDSIPSDRETFEWNVPEELSDECFIKITNLRDDNIFCQNSIPFEIREIPIKLERIELYENVEASTENPDNFIFPGKPLRFKIKVSNYFGEDLNAVSAQLTSSSEYITITNSEVEFAPISQGEDAWSENEFEILLSESIPSSGEYEFLITALDDNVSDIPWLSDLRIPVLKYFPYSKIDDDDEPDSQGNDNNLLEPGEIIEIEPEINNRGQDTLFSVYGQLTCSADYINIWNGITGVDEIVYDTTTYNNSEPIQPSTTGRNPDHDFVFDYNANEIYSTGFILKIFAYLNYEAGETWEEGGVFLKWAVPFTFNEDYPSAVENIAKNNLNIKIVQNPAKDKIIVSYNFQDNKNEDLHLIMYNIQGAEIKEFTINNIEKQGDFIINCSDINSGIYLLKMQKGQKIITQKVVIR